MYGDWRGERDEVVVKAPPRHLLNAPSLSFFLNGCVGRSFRLVRLFSPGKLLSPQHFSLSLSLSLSLPPIIESLYPYWLKAYIHIDRPEVEFYKFHINTREILIYLESSEYFSTILIPSTCQKTRVVQMSICYWKNVFRDRIGRIFSLTWSLASQIILRDHKICKGIKVQIIITS